MAPAASSRRLTEAITTAIGDGIAVREVDEFVKMLRECGRFLVDSGGNSDGPALSRQRDLLAARLITVELGRGAPTTPIASFGFAATPPEPEHPAAIAPLSVATATPEPEAVVPIASLDFTPPAREPETVVPIEALDFTETPSAPDEVVPIETLGFPETASAPDEIVPIESLGFMTAPTPPKPSYRSSP